MCSVRAQIPRTPPPADDSNLVARPGMPLFKGAMSSPQPTRARQPTNATVAPAARDMDLSDETRIRMSGRCVVHGSPPGFWRVSISRRDASHTCRPHRGDRRAGNRRKSAGRLNRPRSNHRPGILQEVDERHDTRARSRRAHMRGCAKPTTNWRTPSINSLHPHNRCRRSLTTTAHSPALGQRPVAAILRPPTRPGPPTEGRREGEAASTGQE